MNINFYESLHLILMYFMVSGDRNKNLLYTGDSVILLKDVV
jgi:uncharacterized Zn ribbon protein